MTPYLDQYLEVTLLHGEVTSVFYPHITAIYERYEHHLQEWSKDENKWVEYKKTVPIVILEMMTKERFHVTNPIEDIWKQIEKFREVSNE